MKSLPFFAAVLVSIGALFASDAMAQGSDRSGGFFEKNYAETPLKPKPRQGNRNAFPDGSFTKPKATAAPQLPQEITPEDLEQMMRDPNNPKWQKEIEKLQPSLSPSNADIQNRDLTGLERAIPVRAVGGIINSLDAEHYQKSLAQLTDLAIARDMNIGTIYAIGDMKVASDTPLMGKILARGGVVHIVSNIPKGYDVSLSPTWIVKTEEGEVLLEGVGGLQKYFNQQGAFLDREKRPTKALPAKNS